jgi:glycine/D-amino acid oxidase-like deaminating enzyme
MTATAGAAAGPDVRPGCLAGTRLVVVGAGVAGASLTWAAARAGAEVTVLEANRTTRCGASAVPAALINPHRGRTATARPGDVAGAAALWRWAAALEARGLRHGAARGGVLRAAGDERQRRAWLTLSEVRQVGAGRFGPFRLPFGGILVETGGWLDPAAWLRALMTAAAHEGATLVEGERAERIEGGAGNRRVVTRGGVFPADLVALCLGAADPGALPAVAIRRVAGDVVLTPHPAVPHALAGAVTAAPAAADGARDGAASYLAVGGNHRVGDERAAPVGGATRLLASVRRVLPSLGDEVAAVWTGVRARGETTEPIVQEVATGVWWVGAFSGRGFLRAAGTAEAVVRRWCEERGGG